MKKVIVILVKLFTGFFLCATGIVMTINANLGLSPWDVLHQGISKIANITMGKGSITVGIIIVILDSILGEKIGWGTILNMIVIGFFMDFLMLNNIIPVFNNLLLNVIMMFLGMIVIGIGTYFYISVGLGSGPRDGLMVALTKKTHKSVRLIRSSIELGALIAGYILGGHVGLGTFIMAISLGHFIQFAFKLFKFDVSTIQHRFIDDDIKLLKERFFNVKEDLDAN
ncbi:MAG: hypothetical protein AB2417_07590 [Clostridiaceae bacterium]